MKEAANEKETVSAKEIVAFRVLASLLWAKEQGIETPRRLQQYSDQFYSYADFLNPVMDEAVQSYRERRRRKKEEQAEEGDHQNRQ